MSHLFLQIISLGCTFTVISSWKYVPKFHQEEIIKIPECMLNIRTVIFTEMDVTKLCWSMSEVQLLVARRVMQNLIPVGVPRNFQMLYRFFEKSEMVLRSKLAEPRIRLFFMAYYDVVGGYIHSVVIPILNEAYYAGNVDYKTIRNFHSLMGRIMAFLDTNGDGWVGPCDMTNIPTKVVPLPLHITHINESCDAFVISPQKNKVDCQETKKEPELNSSDMWNYCSKDFSKIPLPFLDDSVYPSAIAVPLKEHALFSLMSERSVNVLPKYYILAMRCLSSPAYTCSDVVRFNFFFHKWLIKDVMPHLYELRRWYPGFGGVMRIVETMNKKGLASNEHLPKPERPVPTNTALVYLKPSRGVRNNLTHYIAIGLAVLGGVILMWWLLARTNEVATLCDDGSEPERHVTVNTLIASLCQDRKTPPNTSSSSSIMSATKKNSLTNDGKKRSSIHSMIRNSK